MEGRILDFAEKKVGTRSNARVDSLLSAKSRILLISRDEALFAVETKAVVGSAGRKEPPPLCRSPFDWLRANEATDGLTLLAVTATLSRCRFFRSSTPHRTACVRVTAREWAPSGGNTSRPLRHGSSGCPPCRAPLETTTSVPWTMRRRVSRGWATTSRTPTAEAR